MKQVMFTLLILLLCTAAVSAVSFETEHITLLSVMQYENGTQVGGTADFTLQIQPGTGKVFLESYPAAQIDMQVATRLANEYACEYSKADCNQYDFFYTIRSGSPLIGGPSGGGAATVLTLAVLENTPVRGDVAMTGAITSGGILTPVSGVKEKIQAAQNQNYALVIIPYLSLEQTTVNTTTNASTNESILDQDLLTEKDLEQFSIQVRPQLSVLEAYQIATNTVLEQHVARTEAPEWYTTTMSQTADLLCERTQELLQKISLNQTNTSDYTSALDFINKSKLYNESLYAKASYCFSANLPLQRLFLENYDQDVLLANTQRLSIATENYKQKIKTIPIVSFADLETYGIVVERLLETEQLLEAINETNVSRFQLGYAIERYESAVAWSQFFGKDTQAVEFDSQALKQACAKELQSVETRMSYLRSILPQSYLVAVDEHLEQAYEYSAANEHALCLFKATKAKAHANLFFTTLGIDDEQLQYVIELKAAAATEIIARQQPVFPLLGHSYLVYSLTFEDTDYSKLLFTEYAVVHSDVSGYFPPKQPSLFAELFTRPQDSRYFFAGIIVGLGLALVFRKYV